MIGNIGDISPERHVAAQLPAEYASILHHLQGCQPESARRWFILRPTRGLGTNQPRIVFDQSSPTTSPAAWESSCGAGFSRPQRGPRTSVRHRTSGTKVLPRGDPEAEARPTRFGIDSRGQRPTCPHRIENSFERWSEIPQEETRDPMTPPLPGVRPGASK